MENEVTYLYLDDIIPNRFQPRENFDEQALKELAVSIKEHGVIQPIVVRKIGEKYEIIAGERRYKASTMAGLTKIPAIIRNLDDKESSKVALIENLQRKDLTPIEEARTYQKILELDALTQEELAKTMGKSQSAVSNKLRLLSLTDEVQDALLKEKISERHARSLLNIENPELQKDLLNKIITTRMTVRELEEEIKKINPTVTEETGETGTTNNIIPPTNEFNSITPTRNSFNGINPTTIDIEKIKSQSQDIIKPADPLANIESLLKSSTNIQKPAPIEEINNRFVPEQDNLSDNNVIGGAGLLAGMPVGQPINQNISTPSLLVDQKPDIIETMPEVSTAVPTPIPNVSIEKFEKPKDMLETVNNLKKSIKDVENTGVKIDMEEFDFDDFYQIVVRIDKDNF